MLPFPELIRRREGQHKMRTKRPRYQQGSITRIPLASGGHTWRVRFSELKAGKRVQKSLTFSGDEYRTENDVRKAIELEVVKQNRSAERHKVDASFSAPIGLFKDNHLPELEHSTRELYSYVLRKYITKEFGDDLVRDVTPLRVTQWLKGLDLAPTTKASIRTVMSQIFELAALHGYVSAMERNQMSLVKIKGVSKRQKQIQEITTDEFKALVKDLPEHLRMMVVLDGAFGLRISELLALQWADIDMEKRQLVVVRKFTRGRLGPTKTDASNAALPVAPALIDLLKEWKKKTGDSDWLFPSPKTGGPRSASMLLQKGLKPAAKDQGLGNLTWHTLRHACKSWLKSVGADLTTQKDLLRHADISTTSNIYGFRVSEDMRKAHEKLVTELLG